MSLFADPCIPNPCGANKECSLHPVTTAVVCECTDGFIAASNGACVGKFYAVKYLNAQKSESVDIEPTFKNNKIQKLQINEQMFTKF